MKKKYKLLIVILSIFSFLLNVDAAGFSGDGKKFGGSGGGTAGTCKGGYCLAQAAILKFTIVDVSTGNLIPKAYGIMKYEENRTYMNYFANSNEDGYGSSRGMILADGTYSYGAYDINNFQLLPAFSSISNIIPKSVSMLNFDVQNLKRAVIQNYNTCSENSTDCIITNEYANIVTNMMKTAGLIRNEVTSISDGLNNAEKAMISNLRMLIEPLYTFRRNDNAAYIFATTKAAAMMIDDSKYRAGNPYLGTYVDHMYNNLIAKEQVGNAINNYPGGYPIYPASQSANQLAALRNGNDGAGYAIVKLLYTLEPTVNKCVITKDASGNILYYDSLGGAYDNDASGVNFEYFIGDCGCEVTYDSIYFPELTRTNEIFGSIYDNKCPGRTNVCTYVEKYGRYTFYGISGERLSSYNAFIDSCTCSNPNVEALKDRYSSNYADKCILSDSESASSDLRVCSGSQKKYELSYSKTESINEYCGTTCEEVVELDNVVTKDYYDNNVFTAGKYYELPGMLESDTAANRLSVTGTKSCTATINYVDWYNTYLRLLNTVRNAYNDYMGFDDCTYSSGDCRCDEDGNCDTRHRYNCRYLSTEVNSSVKPAELRAGRWASDYHSYCGYDGFDSDEAYAYNSYSRAVMSLNNHLTKLGNCNIDIKERGTTDTEFYTFESELEYHYQQIYKKVDDEENKEVWNEQRKTIIGDVNETDEKLTKYVSDYNTEVTNIASGITSRTGNESDYKPTSSSHYTNGVSESTSSSTFLEVKDEGTVNKEDNTAQTYTRKVQYKFYYRPSVKKYVDTLTGKISSVQSDLVSPSLLGYVYDLDVSAKATNSSSSNNSYYKFTALGDSSEGKVNGVIFDWFDSRGQDNKLKRVCSYKISNDVVCENLEMCVNYRMVDSNEIDPNGRLLNNDGSLKSHTNTNGFGNWRDVKGVAVYNKLKETDTFNPNNIEYSFTLNSATIQGIKDYNEITNYDSIVDESLLDCDDLGNQCESTFLTKLAAGDYGHSVNANLEGRLKWKYLIYNSSTNKWYIDEDNKDETEYINLLTSTTKYKDEGVTP